MNADIQVIATIALLGTQKMKMENAEVVLLDLDSLKMENVCLANPIVYVNMLMNVIHVKWETHLM